MLALKYRDLPVLIHRPPDEGIPVGEDGEGVLKRGDDDNRGARAPHVDARYGEVEPVAGRDLYVEVVLDLILGAPGVLASRVGDGVGGVVGEELVVFQVVHDLAVQDLLEHGLGLGARGTLPVDADERHRGGRQYP